MTPQDFISKWGPGGPAFDLNERQGAQPHFIDLCQLLGVPLPSSAGDYIFEQDTLLLGESRGYADVFYRDHFAWENKAPGKNLDTALKQLLTYSLALSNPPLLVVCDRLTIRIHTQFNGHPSEVHTILLAELDQPAKQTLLRRLWTDPQSFRPQKTSRDITETAAKSFATLADGLRRRKLNAQKLGSDPDFAQQNSGSDPNLVHDEVAHFLTQCLFCFFAEDVGLLPGRMFEGLVNNRHITSDKLTQGLTNLFTVMRDGGLYGNDDIPWFNGGLFKRVKVPALSIMEVTELRNAAALNWSAIDVSIFGTLFERGLDPAKRSQLGAHYTDPATILRIVEPVLSRPLNQKWELIAKDIKGLMAKSIKNGDKHYQAAKAKFVIWLEDLKAYRVLDPACGSGNFLYLALKALKDIEHKSHLDAANMGLDREADLVTGPHNVLGIELNEYAAELARVTVWIGELQWRLAHGYEFKINPVLEPLEHIECRDALLTVDQAEAAWPRANVVIGNPPFLGGSKKRRELGDDYFAALNRVFAGRVPGGADLVCYWFDKARVQLGAVQLEAAGLVATQAIRAGANRSVLEHLLQRPDLHHNPAHEHGHLRHTATGGATAHGRDSAGTSRGSGTGDRQEPGQLGDPARLGGRVGTAAHRLGGAEMDDGSDACRGHVPGAQGLLLTHTPITIFNAWADEPWVNNGAAVRVSLVCFGLAQQKPAQLNGQPVAAIHADLTAGVGLDMTLALALPENANASFEGTKKYGDFDIPGSLARQWLALPNPHMQSNACVVKPWRNGQDLSKRPSDTWIIDYGTAMSEGDAALFEAPFNHVLQHVKPARLKAKLPNDWWLHERARASMRQALQTVPRYIATTRVSKHRHFSYLHSGILADTRLNLIARADDTTFGILSSRIHEVWSLAQASVHGDGADGGRPTYNAKSCFETFPFPAGLTPQDTAHQRVEVLPDGAVIPAEIHAQNRPLALIEQGLEAIKNESHTGTRQQAIAIAQAAKRLSDLRENWLNPPEWMHKVPEVTPLGMDASPYPDRIEPRPGLSEADLKALQKRTLTNLYNAKPAWLTLAHQQLDLAVAAAYGWADYTTAMPDEEILKRLLALNLARTTHDVPNNS